MFTYFKDLKTRAQNTDPELAAEYVVLWMSCVLPDFIFAAKYLWYVAVSLTVLSVWGWM